MHGLLKSTEIGGTPFVPHLSKMTIIGTNLKIKRYGYPDSHTKVQCSHIFFIEVTLINWQGLWPQYVSSCRGSRTRKA